MNERVEFSLAGGVMIRAARLMGLAFHLDHQSPKIILDHVTFLMLTFAPPNLNVSLAAAAAALIAQASATSNAIIPSIGGPTLSVPRSISSSIGANESGISSPPGSFHRSSPHTSFHRSTDNPGAATPAIDEARLATLLKRLYAFQFEGNLEPVKVKGSTKPVSVHCLVPKLQQKGGAGGDGFESDELRFVGRDLFTQTFRAILADHYAKKIPKPCYVVASVWLALFLHSST